jgi:hypothetical protein
VQIELHKTTDGLMHGWNVSNDYFIYRETKDDTNLYLIDFKTRFRYKLENIPTLDDAKTEYNTKEFL